LAEIVVRWRRISRNREDRGCGEADTRRLGDRETRYCDRNKGRDDERHGERTVKVEAESEARRRTCRVVDSARRREPLELDRISLPLPIPRCPAPLE
jgi:hypothetical protein